MYEHFLLLMLTFANHFKWMTTLETCENTVVDIYGEGSYLTGPIYSNAETGYTVKRSSTLKVNFVYNRTNGLTGLNKIARRNNWNQATATDRVLTFAATESSLTTEQQAQFPELLMIPVESIPLAIVFRLPKITVLSFTTQSIVDIYMGKIKYWNDPILQRINPNLNLPNQTIKPVARMDKEASETFVFTSALSSISPQWNATYGTFMDPLFPDDECCDSQKWPKDVILYYGNTANGMTGIVSSIPYTIGYTTVYDAILTKANIAKVYNRAGQLTEPTVVSTQSAVRVFRPPETLYANSTASTAATSVAPRSFFFNVNNADNVDAYPFVTLSYIVINRTTDPNISCCAMQELVGFLLYLYGPETDDLNEEYYIVPLSDTFQNFLIQFLLPLITCKGKSMYTAYMETLVKVEPFDPSKQVLTIVSIIFGSILCLVVSGYVFYWRRIKSINESSWLIDHTEFNQLLEISDFVDENMSMKTTSQSLRIQSQYEMSKNGEKIKAIWNRNGNNLVLVKLCSSVGIKWATSDRITLTRFIKEYQHENLVLFYGLTEISNIYYQVRPLFPKGTLHRCLMYSEYEISYEMKCCISKNVIDGLKYLHRRHVAHGFLNSLSCYVDNNWTVKIGDWQSLSLLMNQKKTYIRNMIDQKRTAIDSDSELIELLYLDPNLTKYEQKEIYHSDIYSYGNLLIEIFSMNLPYWKQVQSGMSTYQSIIAEKFGQSQTILMAVDDAIPENIRMIISLCLTGITKRPDVNWVQLEISNLNVRSRKGIVDIVMSSMEKCIEDRTSELKAMTDRLEGILHEVMPPQIASKLLAGEEVLPEFFDSCTIFFSDIVGFTTISARSTPMEVMSFLNEVWIVFDKVSERFDVYKVDTIGDAYMLASGVPNRNGVQHSKNIADFALALSKETENYPVKHIPNEILKIRMGINSGPVTAGIVGRKMPQYCIFGDTVNTSSRMESTSLPGRIQISSNTHDLLIKYFPHYLMEIRGTVEVKGKGQMTTYWLTNDNNKSI